MHGTDLVVRPSRLDPDNPYPGLHPFTEVDHEFFYGRDRERDELLRLVRRGVVTVLFGASGLGKTSLLNAGLFPHLRRERYLPVTIRLDFVPASGDFAAQAKAAVAFEAGARRVEATPPADGETLWEYFQRSAFWDAKSRLLTPLLVFDQFEEIFTLGRHDERLTPFLTELADLIENRVPTALRERLAKTGEDLAFSYGQQHYKVLLSLREDYLAQLEDLRAKIPSLAGGRFRLTPMDGLQARQAVLEPGGEIVTESVATEIVYFAAGAPSGHGSGDAGRGGLEELEVEPALLALVCRKLNESRREAGQRTISPALLKGGRERIYVDFYDDAVADLPPSVPRFVEDRLLTPSGFRTSAALEEATGAGVSEESVAKLVDRRVLRLSERLGIPHVELIHDVLTSVVRESRDRRLARQVRRKLRLRMLAAAAVVAAVILSLAVWGRTQARLRTVADSERERANVEREQAERAVSVVLKTGDQLRGLGEPQLLEGLAANLRSYVRDLPEDQRGDDTSRLLIARATFFEGLAALERGQPSQLQLAQEKLDDFRAAVKKEVDRAPDDLVWLREMATATEALGDAHKALGENGKALESYEDSKKWLARLAGDEESDSRNLAVADLDVKIADVLVKERKLTSAFEIYQRTRETIAENPEEPSDTRFQKRIREIDGRLGKLAQEQLPVPQLTQRQTTALRRSVFDAQNGRDLPGVLVRAEGGPEVADPVVNTVYDTLGDYYRFLGEVFGRDSLDGSGMPLQVTVHYSEGYNNGYWNGSQVVLGDGDGKIFRRMGLDETLLATQLSHGVVQFTAGLKYNGQPGAVQSHYSDVLAVLFRQWRHHWSVSEARWRIGEFLAPGAGGEALRSLKAPGTAYSGGALGQDPQVDYMDRFVDTQADNGGVHINSGIPNHAFYLAATAIGGYAWEKTGQIWYEALRRLDSESDFQELARTTYNVAGKRYGAGSAEQQAVRRAWSAVGIVLPQRGSSPGY